LQAYRSCKHSPACHQALSCQIGGNCERPQAGRHRLIPTRANTQPAFGCYRRDPIAPIAHGAGMIVLTLAGDQISAVTRFLDSSVMSGFGLPRSLRD
jgi:hypothetical protein